MNSSASQPGSVNYNNSDDLMRPVCQSWNSGGAGVTESDPAPDDNVTGVDRLVDNLEEVVDVMQTTKDTGNPQELATICEGQQTI